jgi:hypothetical protein
MLSLLLLQHEGRIAIQRDASRRSILRLVEPRSPALQVDASSLQSGDLARPAARGKCEARHRRDSVKADLLTDMCLQAEFMTLNLPIRVPGQDS